MSLTKDTALKQVQGDLGLPVLASTTIYQGKAVGLSSGYARQLVAGDRFVGHAFDKSDNSSGANGDINVQVLTGRYRLQVPVTGASAVTDHDKPVYMSDAETYTLTKGSNSLVGKVVKWVSSTNCVVEFDTLLGLMETVSAGGIATVTDDILLADGKAIKADTTTAHTIKLKAYDVDGSTMDTLITLTNGNTPTLTLAADGGINVNDDVLLANGKALKTDTTDAHTLEIQGYDVDGSTRPAMVTVTNGNAPTVTISNTAANGVGFFGKATPATQRAHVADVATNLATDSTNTPKAFAEAINQIFLELEVFGFRATS